MPMAIGVVTDFGAIDSSVLTTSETEIGNHSLAIRCRCAMTPTPAGTNSSDR